MTVKQFFKSTAFKCIITLLCVLLVSGIFLTIMNSLLTVTDKEKFDRAISKIYGQSVETTEQEIATPDVGSSTIKEAYLVNDGNYLIKVTGKEGYDNGTVTCWVVVKITDNKVSGIDKVVIDSNVAQSYIDRVGSKALNQFGEFYTDGIVYEPDLITGATVTGTKTAICNAVNGAITFVKVQLLGEEAKVNPYEKFDLISYINIDQTTHEVNGDGSVLYHVVTKIYGEAVSFKFDITVKDELITNFNITKNGSTAGWEAYMAENILNGELFKGKNLAFFTGTYGDDMQYVSITGADDNNVITGATNIGDSIASKSTYLCMYAGAFATANYQKCIEAAGGNN